MFFDLVSRNSKRSRTENGLFFASLLISIVAFYIILSLSRQDVMVFLSKMESDAVNRLLKLIPIFYAMTLVILFFLIYYASRFQLERRRHEFGVYLMMGMRRFKLFFMLLAEDFYSSVAALLIGLPTAVCLSEFISLVTARLVGLGIIGHRFSLSFQAVVWTAVGFLLIKLAAFLILSGKIARQEIGALLVETPEGTKKALPTAFYTAALLIGVIFLSAAYGMAIKGLAWQAPIVMAACLLLGFTGTMLLFYGLRSVMGYLAKHGRKQKKLQSFTFRQLEENVIHRSGALAVSSLLLLAGLCCFGAGVAIAKHYRGTEQHVLDYTFDSYETTLADIRERLAAQGLDNLFSELFEMKTGYIRTTEDWDHAFLMEAVIEEIGGQPESSDRDILLNNLGYATYPHLICLSDYNRLLDAAGLPVLSLAEGELGVYMDRDNTSQGQIDLMNSALAAEPQVFLDGESFCLTGTVQTVSLVTDRSVTLSFALIVPDTLFAYYTKGEYDVYANGILNPGETAGKSLMQAISEANDRLKDTGLSYESYLQNMGRQLFYVVAASYITIYLAIIFLIIANTVIGVQF